MPQDKRLIVVKAVLYKLRRVSGSDEKAAAEGIYIEFVIPTICLSQCPEMTKGHLFSLPHPVYGRQGHRTTCLIVPKAISDDAFKINKRHGYYDAVVTAEAICRRGDSEAAQRALKVAQTFSLFVVDARIIGKLPPCITDAVARANAATAQGCPVKCLTPLAHLDDTDSLTFRLSQGATSETIRQKRRGQGEGGPSGVLQFRVGHGGMTAGEVCANAKSFVFSFKKDFPTVWKYIHEFKLQTNLTDSIRFMEINIQK